MLKSNTCDMKPSKHLTSLTEIEHLSELRFPFLEAHFEKRAKQHSRQVVQQYIE